MALPLDLVFGLASASVEGRIIASASMSATDRHARGRCFNQTLCCRNPTPSSKAAWPRPRLFESSRTPPK
jgi:hypothetical protein